MSDSKRRAFYRWYLLERTNPGEPRPPPPALECTCRQAVCWLLQTVLFFLPECLFMPRLHRPAWYTHTPPIAGANSSILVLDSCELWEPTSPICKFMRKTEVKRCRQRGSPRSSHRTPSPEARPHAKDVSLSVRRD